MKPIFCAISWQEWANAMETLELIKAALKAAVVFLRELLAHLA
jgi:hypothetical protein